jgi:hypothetical protein
MKIWLVFTLFFMEITLAACNRQAGETKEVDLLGTAAAEATQIIQQARATAMLLEAQRQANTLMGGSAVQTAIPLAPQGTTNILPLKTPEMQETLANEGQTVASPTSLGTTVELISVGVGVEGYFIEIYFHAPPAVAGGWYQGNVSVTEETSGTIYNEIPVLPVVGPLFGKPVEAGQIGYVMLVNAPVPLQAGSFVTVTLGEYIFEHIQVK